MEEKSSVVIPFIDTIQSSYLHQHILQPTRFIEGNEPGLLDLVFSNKEIWFSISHRSQKHGASEELF